MEGFIKKTTRVATDISADLHYRLTLICQHKKVSLKSLLIEMISVGTEVEEDQIKYGPTE